MLAALTPSVGEKSLLMSFQYFTKILMKGNDEILMKGNDEMFSANSQCRRNVCVNRSNAQCRCATELLSTTYTQTRTTLNGSRLLNVLSTVRFGKKTEKF